jgi:phosphoglycerate dehydrogenase-like enzyme
MGFNLHGKTVGVIGTGTIGATFCRVKGFGCKPIARRSGVCRLKELGVNFLPLKDVFRQADIHVTSLHSMSIRNISDQQRVHRINERWRDDYQHGAVRSSIRILMKWII